jgi:hypothetical protein
MIIRIVAVVSLCLMLLLVLYLPAAYTTAQFLQQIRVEHAICSQYWQGGAAARILERTLAFVESKPTRVPLIIQDKPPASPGTAVTQEVARVGTRMFDNAYIRSLNGLFALGAYRLATLVEWLPPFGILLGAVSIDGIIIRAVKKQEFRRHSPEIVSLSACITIMTACAMVLLLVMPWTLHPAVLPVMLLIISIWMNLGIANYAKA